MSVGPVGPGLNRVSAYGMSVEPVCPGLNRMSDYGISVEPVCPGLFQSAKPSWGSCHLLIHPFPNWT